MVRFALTLVVLLLPGCGTDVKQQGAAGCWQKPLGICEEWRSPPAGAEGACREKAGEWFFPSCLTLDAVANCTSGDRSSQVFYSEEKFTVETARAECSTRAGFTFTEGNERTVLE